MPTKRIAVAALALNVVLVVLAVVAFVLWRQGVAEAEFEEKYDECLTLRGLDTVTPLTPGYDGVEYANELANCADLARGLTDS
ncbi:hypothetical protein [Cellulosimicrobium sp. SL-1]|uniref:hypothetical protein n=1 Tax=Cellulosimicrobium sp. SL-1 TaxID=2699423 RepID=UPI0013D558EF|nr:hypothetical protein [Cellulosimicrobium sp. SL-1]